MREDAFCDRQPLRQREIRRVAGQVGKDHDRLHPPRGARSGAEPPKQLLSFGGAMLVPQLPAPVAASPSYPCFTFSLSGIATVQLQVCIRRSAQIGSNSAFKLGSYIYLTFIQEAGSRFNFSRKALPE